MFLTPVNQSEHSLYTSTPTHLSCKLNRVQDADRLIYRWPNMLYTYMSCLPFRPPALLLPNDKNAFPKLQPRSMHCVQNVVNKSGNMYFNLKCKNYFFQIYPSRFYTPGFFFFLRFTQCCSNICRGKLKRFYLHNKHH